MHGSVICVCYKRLIGFSLREQQDQIPSVRLFTHFKKSENQNTFPYLYRRLSTVVPKRLTFCSSFLALSFQTETESHRGAGKPAGRRREKKRDPAEVEAAPHLQAGVNHPVIPRQAQVHRSSQWRPQLLPSHVQGHQHISFLHLPERGKKKTTPLSHSA